MVCVCLAGAKSAFSLAGDGMVGIIFFSVNSLLQFQDLEESCGRLDGDWLRKVRAIVLAGGKSRRMGRDKASLLLLGQSLVDWAVQAACGSGLSASVIRKDLAPNKGPLGGVQTAFQRFEEEWMVFLACDAPFLGSEAVNRLLQAGRQSHLAAFYVVAGRLGFPFLLSRRELPAVEESLRQGLCAVKELARRVRSVKIPVAKADQWRFHNINTEDDWAEARSLAAERQSAGLPL